MFARINHLTLHYRVEGAPSDGPNGSTERLPLVFINSLGCDLRIWDDLIASFAGAYRLVRYDKRGHGLSDSPPGPYAIRDHTLDLAGLLDGLGIRQAVLVGLSVGGLIAMDFALLYPGRARRLVLSNTAPRIGTPESWDERIQAVRERGLDALAESIISRWFTPAFREGRPAEHRGWQNMLARMPREGYLGTCAALRDADLREEVRAIAEPVLVLTGAEDAVVTPEQASEWAGCLPNARVAAIPGAAHLPCIEQPARMAAAMLSFLREGRHD